MIDKLNSVIHYFTSNIDYFSSILINKSSITNFGAYVGNLST
jgi:hypothetical protein